MPTDKNGNIPFSVFDSKTIDAFLKLLIHPIDNLGIDFYSLDSFNKKDLESIYDQEQKGIEPLWVASAEYIGKYR